MAMKAGVGMSAQEDAYQAGYESCALAIERLGSQEGPSIIFLFSSVARDQNRVVEGAREAGGATRIIGCSSAGEITNEGPRNNSVVAMALWSDTAAFVPGLVEGIQGEAYQTGERFAKEINERATEPLKALIMFSDVLFNNGAEIVRGVLGEMGEHFPIVGGAAGDDFHFKQTYEYFDDTVTTGSVAGVGLTGAFTMGLGVRHGWIPIGLPMKVTKSDGAILHELDGKPAVSIYEDYFGGNATDLRKEPLARMAITYPLGIKVPDLDEYLIRDPITVAEDGSITCAAEIPEGSEVRLMIGSKEKAVEAAQDAARKLMSDFKAQESKPECVFIFNCIAREKLFAKDAKDEIAAVMEIIGRDVPMIGFYTYGEQAPLGGEILNEQLVQSAFFNETIVLFALGEQKQ